MDHMDATRTTTSRIDTGLIQGVQADQVNIDNNK